MQSQNIPLKILICDADDGSLNVLIKELEQKQIVLEVNTVDSIGKAWESITSDSYNTIFIDPLILGLNESSNFIFSVREKFPEIVFVLYVDRAKVERQSAEFFRGKRQRLSHYYSLDKQTPVVLFADELESILRDCQLYLSLSVSTEKLNRIISEAKNAYGAKKTSEHTQFINELQEVLFSVQKKPKSNNDTFTIGKTVFLSYRFAEDEYVNGLQRLLEQNGFEITTGKAANKYISRAILDRIKEADFFLGLMTRHEEKTDGTYTTSPWLLEEKGAALAFGKRIVLMVEEGVVDIGGLQGDWQRIHFGPKGFLNAALEAVDQLKSYVGEI